MSNAPSSLGSASNADGEFEWQFSVKLADNTCEIPAVIAGADGTAILGDPNSLFSTNKKVRKKALADAEARLRDAVGEGKVWEMSLQSAEVGGVKIFVIRAVERWVEVEEVRFGGRVWFFSGKRSLYLCEPPRRVSEPR